MKTITMAVVLLLGAAFIAAPGSALHCNGNITEIAVGSETVYIDDRADDPNAPPGSGFVFGPGGTWIYLESNGIVGLQSGGSAANGEDVPFLSGVDSCSHPNPDTVIF